MTKLLMGIVLSLFVVGCGANVDAPAVVEEGLTGGLDLDAYCKRTWGPSAYAGIVAPGDAWSWVCQVGDVQHGMDLQAACVQQYGSNATVQLGSVADPYSWSCTYGCSKNADCGSGNYCKKPSGQCGAVGQCAVIPTGLCATGNRVCGCDGRTYATPCFAAKAGVNVKHVGSCP